MLKDEILDVLAKQLNGGEMLRIRNGGVIHGGAIGDVYKFDVDGFPTVYFREPAKKGTPSKLFTNQKMDKRLDEDTEEMMKTLFYKGIYDDDTFKKVKTKSNKNPAKAPKKQDDNCKSAVNQAQSVMRFYNYQDGKISKNSDFKSIKDLQDTVMKLVQLVDDDRCDAYDKSIMKQALELYNKKNPAKAPKKNPAKQPKKNPAKAPKKQKIDPLHQVTKKDAKKSKSVNSVKPTNALNKWNEHLNKFRAKNPNMPFREAQKEAKKTYDKPQKKVKDKATHKMPDGSIHTGKKHTKDSKVVKPAPKKQAKTSAPVCQTKKGKFQKCNAWIEHVREYQDMNGTTWKESIIQAKATYKKSAPKSKAKAKSATKSKAKKIPKYNKKNDITFEDGEEYGFSAKDCPKGKVRNPSTNRCKKEKRVNKKKREPSAWDIHLKEVRLNNPQVKGKDVMKLAKESYNKTDKKSTNVQETRTDYLENKYLGKNAIIKQPIPLPTIEDKEQSKDSNESLADAFESFDNFNRELQSVVNSEMMRKDKEEELDNIRNRFTDYNNLLYNNRDNFTAEAFVRKNKAYDFLIESYKLAVSVIKDGEQNIDLEEYGEEENLDRLVQDALYTESTPLFDGEYAYVPPDVFDYIDDDDELDNFYRENLKVDQKYDGDINPLYNMVPSIDENIELDYPYEELYDDLYLDIEPSSVVESRKKRIKIEEVDSDEEDEIIKEFEDSKKKAKPKRKIPLNLRLYQAFQRLMKQNDSGLTRKEVDIIWKENKEEYIDMLMDVVEKNGGNILNEDHYYNAFNNIGGMMCGGNLFEDFTGYKAPEKERRIDSLEDWGDSIADIAKATATGVFNVGKIFNPFSWF